jgi:hypothetical protein
MQEPWLQQPRTFAYALSSPYLQPHSHVQRSSAMDEAEVDAIARMEEQELQDLIALEQDHGEEMEHIPSSPSRYGSDEEEYDDIFMEILSSQDAPREEDGMDLSNG